jgi:hypothetical protein
MMPSSRDQLTKEEAMVVASVEHGVPTLTLARDLVKRFGNLDLLRARVQIPA